TPRPAALAVRADGGRTRARHRRRARPPLPLRRGRGRAGAPRHAAAAPRIRGAAGFAAQAMKKRRKSQRPRARLLYAASEKDADILYPTGFFAPDPFLFVQSGRTRTMVMSDLEMDRAKAQSKADRVVSWSRFQKAIEARGRKATAA